MSASRCFGFSILILAVLVTAGRAATIRVRHDLPTITDVVAASIPVDSVVVSCLTYYVS